MASNIKNSTIMRFHWKFRHLISSIVIVIFMVCFIFLMNYPVIFNSSYYGYEASVNRAPAEFLSNILPNESYCNFRYSLPEELLYEEAEIQFSPQQGDKLPYRILYNIIEGKVSTTDPQVTYVTHVTADFVNYIAEIARFWEGPISVAAFVPDFDADLVIRQLEQLCRCSPEMSKVSVHFVFPVDSPPYMQNHETDGQHCKIKDSTKFNTFRETNSLKYPINICRNVARSAASTYFVMVADVQLLPSKNLASEFISMIQDRNVKRAISPSRVFVVPTFEVDDNIIPRTKVELIALIRNEKAVYFHRYICTHCQKFPGIYNWYQIDTTAIKPYGVVKREHPYHRWEPIYIGSKKEPYYNELMSWEGVQDKMTQMLEMCLIGYDFVILDGAFLVHWPGIKRHHTNKDKEWASRRDNAKYYDEMMHKLREKYGANEKCFKLPTKKH